MPIKKFTPITPGRRHMTVVDYSGLTKKAPEKRLLGSTIKDQGRGNLGNITIRRRGGGHTKKYRIIDFKQNDKMGIPGKIKAIEYDPNRTSFIALVAYKDGEKRYILAADKMKIGTEILAKEKTKIRTGSRMMIKNIPSGYDIHNLELTPGKGGQIVRSAGSSAKMVACEGEYAQVKLPSGEVRYVSKNCYASIGVVSNIDHSLVMIGKAGRARWMGRRPSVRGKAMNAADHPHGGGEGGCSIGMAAPKTKWGMPALGFKTRKRKYSDKMIVKDRRQQLEN